MSGSSCESVPLKSKTRALARMAADYGRRVPTTALLLALAAAGVHALWNLLLARSPDVQTATAVALVVSVVVFAPVAAVVWDVDASVWPFVAAGSGLQLVY